jgi:hypothetical protein
MKKAFFLVLLISVFGSISAQTILNRFPIELKKSSSYFQILNAENQKQDYFVCITDKEKNTVLKYNSALFFTDSLSIPRPDKDFDFMSGVTFSSNGMPNLYWSSKNYKKIKVINFDFTNRTTSSLVYENNFDSDKIIDAFVANNSFYILAITSENKLKFTHFSNSGKNEYFISLNSEKPAKQSDFTAAILEKGITKIDSKLFNPLYIGAAKVKRYLSKEQLILTFDGEGQTAVFSINLNDFSVKESLFPYEKLEKKSKSNSYLHFNVLYQLTANSEVLLIAAIDLESKNSLGSNKADSKKEIEFKNSPLFIQSENGRTRELKKTSKFLSKVDSGTVGLTIYSTPNYDLFTIGGIREVASGGNIALGLGLVIGGAIGGTVVAPGDFIQNDNLQSIYFESFFDANFKHLKVPFRSLYIDALGQFLNSNRISVQNLYLYQNYVILNYYDSKTNEFVMRKFQDIAY